MLRIDTGGGVLGIFCITVFVIFGTGWLIAEVIAPIIRYLMPGVEL